MPTTAPPSVRDYPAIATQYAKWAVSRAARGRVCKWVRLACQRHLNDLKRAQREPSWGYWFDDRLPDGDEPGGWAFDVCDFVEQCPHVEGQWDSPTITLEPWQAFILASVFGWRRGPSFGVDEGRRFNTVYEELARKNAKSTKMGAVGLYCLAAEGEIGPQIKAAATTGDQARIVWGIAKRMVDRTPDMREAFTVEAFANSIVCHVNGGDFKPINSKASTQDGLNPHLTIIDELHAHKERALFDVLKSARGARKNPLSWYITTAGYNTEGVCFEQRRLVTQILEGVIEADHYFGIIYTIDEGDDEFDEKVWGKANPNLGVSVNLTEFQGYAAEARVSPDSHIEFRTKRLNIWTSAKSGWVSVPRWQACGGPVDLEALRTVPCYAGLDLASTQDMSAWRLVWDVDGRLKTWGRYWVPEERVKPRTERYNVPYARWLYDGYLTATPGNVTDYEYIERDIALDLARFDIQQIAYDPWNASDLVNRLVAAGAPMVELRQTVAHLSGPMKEVERRYVSGMMDHGGDPVLLWNVSNVVARKDANDNIAPDRKNSFEKIDGFAALLGAVSRLMAQEAQPTYDIVIL